MIAATNTELATAVKERRFRVPSLAERREDIAELALSLYADACRRHSLRELPVSAGVLHALEAAADRASGDSAAEVAPLSFQDATRRFQSELLRRVLAETD